jgi:hypothetical protein
MNLRATILATLSIFLLLCVSASFAQSTLEGFQGLPWGATEQQVQSRFPKAATNIDCPDYAKRIYAAFHEVCDHPVIDPYEVAGIPFKLSFLLSERERLLSRVSLYYNGPVQKSIAGISARDTAVSLYKALRSLLTDKFGRHADEGMAEKGGLVVANCKWRLPGTTIKLSLTFRPGYGTTEPSEELQVIYGSVALGESGKL